LLEAAYAELMFLPCMWPDFKPETLQQAVADYRGVERRFGLTSEQVDETTAPLALVRAAALG
jgi:undecaprenyl diphosphate synthase